MMDTQTHAIRSILAALLAHVDRETCTHEETYRGGSIWTICKDCDRKWADDRGGFKPHEDAPAVAAARAALASPAAPVAQVPVEPVAEVAGSQHMHEIRWESNPRWLPLGTKLYVAAPAVSPLEAPAQPSEAYDRIDRFLRNNLDDADYAEYSAALDAIYCPSAPPPAPLVEPGAPEGKWVPLVPTQAMLDAVADESREWTDAETYAAMLAAAPPIPQQAVQPLRMLTEADVHEVLAHGSVVAAKIGTERMRAITVKLAHKLREVNGLPQPTPGKEG